MLQLFVRIQFRPSSFQSQNVYFNLETSSLHWNPNLATHHDLELLTAGELVRAVEELRLGAGAEHTRRRELEAALRESAVIFKRELHDKNLKLAALQQQLG